MIEQPARFCRAFFEVKGILHDQDYIHIVRFRLGGDIAAKNDQALQVAGSASQFHHVHQTARASVPAGRLSAKPPDDFGQGGPMDVRGQIAEGIELRQRHVRSRQSVAKLLLGGLPIDEFLLAEFDTQKGVKP